MIPAIAERERAVVENVLTGVFLPACAGPLHAQADEGLARRFDVAAANGQPALASLGVVEAVSVVLQVGDGVVDGLRVCDPNVLKARGAQLTEDASLGEPSATPG